MCDLEVEEVVVLGNKTAHRTVRFTTTFQVTFMQALMPIEQISEVWDLDQSVSNCGAGISQSYPDPILRQARTGDHTSSQLSGASKEGQDTQIGRSALQEIERIPFLKTHVA